MKKLFVALTALTMLGANSFAAPSKVADKVSRAAKEAQSAVENKKAEVLENFKHFREVVENRKTFNGSYVMQDMLYLLDSYLELADISETAAVSLNDEINQPIHAGWGRTVAVPQLIRDNKHHVRAHTTTADAFDRFESLLGEESVEAHAERTVAAAPRYADKAWLKKEAAKTFSTYFAANPKGEVQQAAYVLLAELLSSAKGLNDMIARAPIEDKENFAIQYFFSADIPDQYAALKAINPQLASATNELMKSFMETVSHGSFYGGADHPDMKAMRAFKIDIGF